MIRLTRIRPFGYEIRAAESLREARDHGHEQGQRYVDTGECAHCEASSALVQLDYDYPSLAGTFGWSVKDAGQVQGRGYYGLPDCEHDGTDGTIQCPGCGLSAVAFIESAAAYLDEHDGATAEDPGYFLRA